MRLELQADLDDVEGRDDEARYQARYGAGRDDLKTGALRLVLVGAPSRGLLWEGAYLIFELLYFGRHA